ncbi:unnamed protein product [Trichogramma brassicae]|uniref:Bax inhibitor 1 n=1 Tax=Trichogramma brassicae TaxID=86971 RepID=A0A6H5ILT7_9HYME|nr:unnamed protein product [Trichogramma brassicae]
MAPTIHSFMNSFTNKLESPVRKHLKNVYGCLSLSTLSAAFGAYVHLHAIFQASFLTTCLAFGLLIALVLTPDNGKNHSLRLGYFLGFSFFTGIGLGPLLSVVIAVDPSIVMTALIGTSVLFVSFSISSLLSERGQWLYLGGILISAMNLLMFFSLANLFFRSNLIYQLNLYIGLMLMCGYIIYDTQHIIEKNRMGNKDFIAHALDLFLDLVHVFRHLLILLTKKEEDKKRKQ